MELAKSQAFVEGGVDVRNRVKRTEIDAKGAVSSFPCLCSTGVELQKKQWQVSFLSPRALGLQQAQREL